MKVRVRRAVGRHFGSRGPASGAQPDLQADLARARWLADLLDTRFSIGGVRFGVDALVGLIPGLGDVLGVLPGLYPLFLARRHRLGRTVQARMALNLLVELGVGAIPIVGDLFDFGFKANVRNVRLLERAAAKLAKD
jgi:hypothetical protein